MGPSPADTVKINTDAGFIGVDLVGLGMVARGADGQVLIAAVKRIKLSTSPEFAEALATRWGMHMARVFNFDKVILECDALSTIMSLSAPKPVLAPIGVVLDDIVDVASSLLSFSCSHVKRDGNKAAHYVARLIPNSGSKHVFVNNFPQGLQTLVGFDLH